MANYTENYNLIMPAQEDYYDVQEFNDNMEAIDTGMAELDAEVSGLGTKLDALDTKVTTLSGKINALDAKIGTQNDAAGTNTLYGLLKNNTPVFKSWNRYTYINGTDVNASVAIPITPVDASRSFVIVERLRDRYDWLTHYDFTLEDTQINLEHEQAVTGYLHLAFTVIELY